MPPCMLQLDNHMHITLVLALCPSQNDKTSAGDTPEQTFESALWAFKQEIKHKTDNVGDGTWALLWIQTVCRCIFIL